MESLILSALELTYIMIRYRIYPEFDGPRLNTHSKSNEIINNALKQFVSTEHLT